MHPREILNRIPFKVLVPFFYLIFFLSLLLNVLLSPFAYMYGLLLCSRVWIEWAEQGKDTLVVHADGPHSDEWMSRIRPVIGDRAIFLNYNEHDQWDRWSVPAQLFEIFGPQAMPASFRRHSLPSVIFFRRLHRPKKFSFGERSKECEAKLEQLRAELAYASAQLVRSRIVGRLVGFAAGEAALFTARGPQQDRTEDCGHHAR